MPTNDSRQVKKLGLKIKLWLWTNILEINQIIILNNP